LGPSSSLAFIQDLLVAKLPKTNPVCRFVEEWSLIIRSPWLTATHLYLSSLSSRRYVSNLTSKSILRSSLTSTVVVSCTNPADPSDATPIR
jgi:hypothetical protein